jgi:hypothetical protein
MDMEVKKQVIINVAFTEDEVRELYRLFRIAYDHSIWDDEKIAHKWLCDFRDILDDREE